MSKRIDQAGRAGVVNHAGGLGVPYCKSLSSSAEKDLDTRSDVYSLGHPLSHGDGGRALSNPTRVAKSHLEDPVPSPRQKNPQVSAKADWVILKMMFKTRERRHPTPLEVQKDLEEIVGGGTPKGFAPEARAASASPGPNTRLRRMTRGRGFQH